MTGQHFGAYRLIGELGRGGMGVVYRAEHEHLGRIVALKLLTPDLADSEGFRDRFLRESRLAASLEHPNIVPVYDAGEVNGTLYLAMRFVSGTDLAAVLSQQTRLDPATTVGVLKGVADALDAAHERGLVHRDVKPANVMIEDRRCYLTDFGLTKSVAEQTALTQTGQFLGTVDYVAPEQIEGRPLDGRADVYALGCMLHQCLTGSTPYPRDSQIAIIYAHLKDEPPRPCEQRPELPAAVDEVVAQAMAKDPEERYATAGEMATAAEEALGGTIENATTAPRAKPPRTTAPRQRPPTAPTAPGATEDRHVYGSRERRKPSRAVLAAVAGALVAAVAIGAVALSGGGGDGGGSSGEPESQPRLAGKPFKVGEGPIGVVAGTGVLWVANRDSGDVTRVATDGSLRTDIDVGDGPFGVARSPGAVWIANSDSESVTRIDVETGDASDPIPVGSKPYFVAADDSSVFVSNGGSNSVSVLDARSGEKAGDDIPVGPSPRGIVAGGTAVWVAIKGENTVERIVNGQVTKSIPVGENPVSVALGEESLWVTNKDAGTVSRIDLGGSGTEAKTIPVGSEPEGIAVGEGFAWVALGGEDKVIRLDLESGEPVGDPVPVPNQPVGVAIGEGSVWVTANDGHELFRIEP
jgi:YVTN family beta-propeller protein